jgi:diketogulonate reductase-like aldo/keto reductase
VLPSNASGRGTIAACERSLKRLKTDHLDCYLLHWRRSYPLEDTVAAFDQLIADGKVRSWGSAISMPTISTNCWRSRARAATPAKGALSFAGARDRACCDAVVRAAGVAAVAYSPFGYNDFPSPRSREGQVLHGIADARRVTARQIALAFLTRLQAVFAIPKAASGTFWT